MDIKFARIRFNTDTSKYYNKPITDIKENASGDDETHITPVNETNFDSKRTYYCKRRICEESNCIENHEHYKYHPSRIFLLGESEENINEKMKHKRCAIPKVPSDLGELRSERNENVLKDKVQEGNKNAKAKKLRAKSNRSKAILKAISNVFVDSDDANSESSNMSNQSKQSEKIRPVSVCVEKLDTCIASQPSTSHQSEQFENVENDFLQTESSCSFSTTMNETALLEPSRKKLKNSSFHQRRTDNTINDEDFQSNIATGNNADNVIVTNHPVDDKNDNQNANNEIIPQFEPNDDRENIEKNHRNNNGENDGRNNGQHGQNGHNNGENNANNREVHNEDSEDDIEQNNEGTKEKMKEFILNSIKYYKAPEGPGFEDRQRRYNVADGQMYLGENISVPTLEWEMANLERATIFLGLVLEMLWNPHDLVNRALEINENMINIPGRSPIKLIETQRLRLLISLYHEYLKCDKTMDNLTKASYLLKTTYTVRTKLNNLRRQEKKARAPRNAQNARRRLRYNIN